MYRAHHRGTPAKQDMGDRLYVLILFFHILLTMCVHGSGARVMLEIHLKEETSLHHDNYQPLDRQGDMDNNGNEDATDVMHDDISTNKEISHLGLHSRKDDHLHMHVKQDDDEHGVVHEHAHSHMDSLLNVFLVEKDLRIGYRMPIYFPHIDPSSSPHFLPRENADAIPFSSSQLPSLLQKFSFSNTSPQAKAMKDTLSQCELEPITGETKFCATSLESTLEFTSSIFGMGSKFKVVTTTHHRESRTAFLGQELQNYTIVDVPLEIFAPKMVACHTMPYPYAVLYCHYQVSKSKVFRVPLIGESGEGVDAVVVCHLDTSAWDPDHVSFRALHIKPGIAPVCHFFPEDHLVWVPSPSG